MFGRLVAATLIWYASLPSDALLDPRWGVPRKKSPHVAGAISFSRVPSVADDLLRAALTMMPPRLCTTKTMGLL